MRNIIIALFVGFLFGGGIGFLIKTLTSKNNFQPLGKKRTITSFADRLYGEKTEKFRYPAYLTPGTVYDLPVSFERKTKAFGNVLTGSPSLCCINKNGSLCKSSSCPENCDCDYTFDVNKIATT